MVFLYYSVLFGFCIKECIMGYIYTLYIYSIMYILPIAGSPKDIIYTLVYWWAFALFFALFACNQTESATEQWHKGGKVNSATEK